jgi:chaperonin GroES
MLTLTENNHGKQWCDAVDASLSKPKLRAIRDKVIIRRLKQPEVVGSGILIAHPDWQPPPDEGIVVAVGPGRRSTRTGEIIPTSVQVGQKVAFKWMEAEQAGRSIKWEGEELKVLDEGQLCGIVEEEKAPAGYEPETEMINGTWVPTGRMVPTCNCE